MAKETWYYRVCGVESQEQNIQIFQNLNPGTIEYGCLELGTEYLDIPKSLYSSPNPQLDWGLLEEIYLIFR